MHIHADPFTYLAVGWGVWWAWKRYVLAAPRTPRVEYRDHAYADHEFEERRLPREEALALRHQEVLDAERRNALELAEEIERLR